MSAGLFVAGIEQWMPLDVRTPRGTYVEQLCDRFGDDPRTRIASELVADLAGAVARHSDHDPGHQPLCAWVRLASPQRLEVLGHAMLAVTTTGDTPDNDSAVDLLLSDLALYQAATIEEITTASGPAQALRARYLVPREDRTEVNEIAIVFWNRPELEALFTLSHINVDLTAASLAYPELIALAEGVTGL